MSQNDERDRSLPMRGAWIEMAIRRGTRNTAICRSPCGERGLKLVRQSLPEALKKSLPMRGAWIEIKRILQESIRIKSLPMRGAWIEILCFCDCAVRVFVAPHAGSVD